MRGEVHLDVLDAITGKLVHRVVSSNLFLTTGYSALCRLLAGDVATDYYAKKVQFGTGSNAPVITDTALQMPITPTAAVTASYPSKYEVDFDAYLLAAEGNGFAISEVGLLSNNNTLLARTTFASVMKTSDYIFHLTWKVNS